MKKTSLLAIACGAIAPIGARAVVAAAKTVILAQEVEAGIHPPYPPEVERRAQRVAWGRHKKLGKRK